VVDHRSSLNRRDFVVLTTALLVASAPAHAAGEAMSVLKTSGCGCCLAWVKRTTEAGFAVTARNVSMGELMKFKLDAGLKAELASCHTARIGGYVVEGHVPAGDIRRLLAERPDAIGLAGPGMPTGSPGMESGSEIEPYSVLLVRKDGSTAVFARYGER
jgi:hypothetical protein